MQEGSPPKCGLPGGEHIPLEVFEGFVRGRARNQVQVEPVGNEERRRGEVAGDPSDCKGSEGNFHDKLHRKSEKERDHRANDEFCVERPRELVG